MSMLDEEQQQRAQEVLDRADPKRWIGGPGGDTLDYRRKADPHILTSAQHLIELVGDSVAWNLPSGDHWKHRTRINQHGTQYVFPDGSAVWIAKGTAKPVLTDAAKNVDRKA